MKNDGKYVVCWVCGDEQRFDWVNERDLNTFVDNLWNTVLDGERGDNVCIFESDSEVC